MSIEGVHSSRMPQLANKFCRGSARPFCRNFSFANSLHFVPRFLNCAIMILSYASTSVNLVQGVFMNAVVITQ